MKRLLPVAALLSAMPATAAVNLALQPAVLPVPVSTTPYGVQFSASGGRAPYTFFVTAGRLPSELTWTLDGLLSGTPGAAGPFSFNVTALDGDGRRTTVTQAGEVDAGIPIPAPQTLSVLEDQALPVVLTAVDLNSAVLTYAVAETPQHGELAGSAPTLTYRPAADYFGTDAFQFTASDGTHLSTPALIGVTVTPVNDAPRFTGAADVTALRNAGPVVLPGWATVTSLGAANETAQAAQFVLTANTRPALFSVAPVIAPDGTLSFTPSGTAGIAALTFELRDDGGSADGGVDRTPPQFFTIALQSPGTDLSVRIEASAAFVDNAPLQFTVRAENAGPSPAEGAAVDIGFPPQLTAVQWSCSAEVGANCTATGSGDIADSVEIPVNGAVVYTVQATVAANGAGQFAVDAAVSPGTSAIDPDPSDDTDMHVFNVDAVFYDGFEN
jgi:hypothetical protein